MSEVNVGSSSSILALFQSLVCGQIRSETNLFFEFRVAGPIGLIGFVRDNQGSFQMPVSLPLPIAFPSFESNRSFPITISLHPCEAVEVAVASKKGIFAQYLPMSSRANKQEGLLRILQLSFANKASLKLCISKT